MSEELKRALARGAQAVTLPKHVKVEGLQEAIDEMRKIAEAQQHAQQILIESIHSIVAAIESKELKSTDIQPLVEAVRALKIESVTKGNTVCDYQLDFERDPRTDLMKSGAVFRAVPHTYKEVN